MADMVFDRPDLAGQQQPDTIILRKIESDRFW